MENLLLKNPFTTHDDPIEEFIYQSNLIENESRLEAFYDGLKAWKYALANRTDMNVNTVLGIHRHLMKTIDSRIAGELRDCAVFIGRSMCPFTSKADLTSQLAAYLRKFNPNGGGKLELERYDWNKEKYAQSMHVEFEKIHPFFDGNGRVGRILYNIHRLLLGLPLHIIHAGEEQFDYYTWFH
jgi:fido (protein-threonine AMPylation protein)